MINPIVKTIELGDGRTITLETGKLAKQADGSVMLRMGNTMLLATVCAAKDAVPVSYTHLIGNIHVQYNVTHDTVFLLDGYNICSHTENFLPQIIL